MKRFQGFARLRPLLIVALIAGAGMLITGHARQADASPDRGYLRCIDQCRKMGDRVERACLRDGIDPTECAETANAAEWQCRDERGCGFPYR